MKLCFIHLPKTGGTAIQHGFAALEIPAFTCRRVGPIERSDIQALEDPGLRVVQGHYQYDSRLRQLADVLVTVVREPIARVYSLYRYARARADNPLYALARQGLRDFIRADVVDVANHQSAMLLRAVDARNRSSLALFDILGTTDDLHSFWQACCRSLGVEEHQITPLPNVNVMPKDPEAEALTPYLRRVILSRNGADLELYQEVSWRNQHGGREWWMR